MAWHLSLDGSLKISLSVINKKFLQTGGIHYINVCNPLIAFQLVFHVESPAAQPFTQLRKFNILQ
jgi:hypothetical protein